MSGLPDASAIVAKLEKAVQLFSASKRGVSISAPARLELSKSFADVSGLSSARLDEVCRILVQKGHDESPKYQSAFILLVSRQIDIGKLEDSDAAKVNLYNAYEFMDEHGKTMRGSSCWIWDEELTLRVHEIDFPYGSIVPSIETYWRMAKYLKIVKYFRSESQSK